MTLDLFDCILCGVYYMTKNELGLELEYYLHHIVWANDYYDAYNSIMDGGTEYYEEISLANTFFIITRYSLISSFLMEITKLFDQREDKCIPQLIKLCRQNSVLFSADEYYIIWNDNEIVHDLNSLLVIAEQSIQKLDSQIKSLMARRDRYYAHNDKRYFATTSRLADDYPINQQDVNSLLELSSGICNSLLGALNGNHIHPRHINNDDLVSLLMCARKSNSIKS